jgi:exodeoxyribonuclease VII large subunit
VQGVVAAGQIAEALKLANHMKESDVLIIARGGGSIEDLWAFNEEIVVRAIHSSQIPVVTGIGHEVDVTLSDFAADYRSETPTAAAESVVPEGTEIMNTVVSLYRRLQATTYHMIQNSSQHVDLLASRLQHPIDLLQLHRKQLSILQSSYIFACKTAIHRREIESIRLAQKLDRLSPKVLVVNQRLNIKGLNRRLGHLKSALINNPDSKLASVAGRLRALSPEHTLQRGYSILRDAADGHLLASANSVQDGQSLEIEMLGGWLESSVNRVHKDKRSKTLRLSGRNNSTEGNS